VLAPEVLELGNELRAEAARELGVDPVLDGRDPQLGEPRRLGAGERLVQQVRERLAAEEPEGGAVRRGRFGGGAAREPVGALGRSRSKLSRSSSPGSTRSR
jgi:hypothetical protein